MKKILVVTILALTTSVIACGPDRVVRENTVERSYSSSSVEAPPPPTVVQERSSTTVEKKSSTTQVIQ